MSINYLHGNPVKAGYLESKKNHGKRGGVILYNNKKFA
jgi:hypothetical protein